MYCRFLMLYIYTAPEFGQAGWVSSLRWRHNERDCVSDHQPRDCLLNRLFERRSKKTLKLRVTGLCAGNSPGTGEFPAQMASYAENVSIWWRHHVSCHDLPKMSCASQTTVKPENSVDNEISDRCFQLIWDHSFTPLEDNGRNRPFYELEFAPKCTTSQQSVSKF